jgi:hypothetical protein
MEDKLPATTWWHKPVDVSAGQEFQIYRLPNWAIPERLAGRGHVRTKAALPDSHVRPDIVPARTSYPLNAPSPLVSCLPWRHDSALTFGIYRQRRYPDQRCDSAKRERPGVRGAGNKSA